MSTRVWIGIERSDKTIEVIYCHEGGHPSCFIGRLLADHYNNTEKVERLLKIGPLIRLAEHIEPPEGFAQSIDHLSAKAAFPNVCVSFPRDRRNKDDNYETIKFKSWKEMIDDPDAIKKRTIGWIEWIYIFVPKGAGKCKWRVVNCTTCNTKPVQRGLVLEPLDNFLPIPASK